MIKCLFKKKIFPGPLSIRHRQLVARNPMFAGLNIQPATHRGLSSVYPNW